MSFRRQEAQAARRALLSASDNHTQRARRASAVEEQLRWVATESDVQLAVQMQLDKMVRAPVRGSTMLIEGAHVMSQPGLYALPQPPAAVATSHAPRLQITATPKMAIAPPEQIEESDTAGDGNKGPESGSTGFTDAQYGAVAKAAATCGLNSNAKIADLRANAHFAEQLAIELACDQAEAECVLNRLEAERLADERMRARAACPNRS